MTPLALVATASPPERLRPSDGDADRPPAGSNAAGIDTIEHLIFVVQENRSFDHYFGTFPGANGIPDDRMAPSAPACPIRASGRCRRPFHDTNTFDQGRASHAARRRT